MLNPDSYCPRFRIEAQRSLPISISSLKREGDSSLNRLAGYCSRVSSDPPEVGWIYAFGLLPQPSDSHPLSANEERLFDKNPHRIHRYGGGVEEDEAVSCFH
jgi:hypothetical protein